MIALALATYLFAQTAPLPRVAGTVTGQIRARDGQFAVGVRVTVLEVPESAPSTSTNPAIGGFSVTDSSGRYRIESVHPGRYYIVAGVLDSPSYYPGVSTLREAKAITVEVDTTAPGMDFTLTRPVGARVTGRIRGIPADTAGVHVVLDPSGLTPRVQIETPALTDGTFLFPKAPPGEYMVRLNPDMSAAPVWITVEDADVQVELTATRIILGRVRVEDGSMLPVQGTAVVNGTPDPPLSFQIRAWRVGSPGVSSVAVAQRNGTFLLTNMEGEYKFTVTLLPFGYWVKTMSYGAVDLARDTLKLPADSTVPRQEIQVILTTEAPDKRLDGVTVQGKVPDEFRDSFGEPRWITLQTRMGIAGGISVEQWVGEAPVGADGSFVIHRVPPGTYVARMIAAGRSAVISTNFVVTDQDLTDVVLTPPPPPPPGPPIGIP